jgi:predicted transcriptional regulator of viral defense system
MKKEFPYIFREDEILKDFDNKKQLNNKLVYYQNKGLFKKIRKGLYATVDENGILNSNKFEIASKISPTSYVSYHSALEYYGLALQVYSYIFVTSETRFNEFEYEDIVYYCHINHFCSLQVEQIGLIKVTSLERTIVDCLDCIHLCGDIDELLSAIDMIESLNEEKLLEVLNTYNKVILYQKVGYVLEQFKEQLNLSDNFFIECQKHLTNQVKYLWENNTQYPVYNKKWQLIAPKDLRSFINGGVHEI